MSSRQDRARRALEQIAYSDDPSIPVGARTQALGELSRLPPASDLVEHLTDEQVQEELLSLRSALDGSVAVAEGAGSVKPPVDVGEHIAVIELQPEVIEKQEARIRADAGQHHPLAYPARRKLKGQVSYDFAYPRSPTASRASAALG